MESAKLNWFGEYLHEEHASIGRIGRGLRGDQS
jgi:hypothetical protein